jgi:2,4-dienoyl-CoA reductase-like NADH-dependent reductase (Old Yellow Enzyme family)/thioredoxin reductase
LTPIRIGNVEIKNRVVRTAHGTLLGAGTVNDELIAYHMARARGGVGLSVLEAMAVHWSCPGPTINIFTPGVEDSYRRLIDTIRPTGMTLFQQLWHAGHNGEPADGSPPWSASDVPGVYSAIPPLPMSKGMIDEMVGAYADTCGKVAAWGVEGVEIHCAHGYLPAQFLAASTNHRTDEYGGSFENRIRFIHEIFVAVRKAVPKGFVVGIRLAPDDLPNDMGVNETLAAAHYLEERGLIDYVNVSLGTIQTVRRIVGGMHEPTGYELPTSTQITRKVSLPTIVTGRFRTLEEADQVIRSGDASMVSFVRAMLADPDLVAKTMAGHPEQVRPCIGCNQGCHQRVFEPPFRVGCAVNVGAGNELTLGDDRLKKVTAPKRVLVVGGGPAGMEAARVAALRGHDVTLAEATPVLGGALLAASKAPTRHVFRDFTTWLEQEVYRLGVKVRLSTYLEADDVTSEPWDAVIVATGSTPRMDGLQTSNPSEPIIGINQPHVISSNDLMMAPNSVRGQSAVVVDDSGHYEALAVADHLVSQGLEVSLVTRFAAVGPRIEWALMVEPALIRMAQGKFTPYTRSRLLSIGRDSVTMCPTYLPSSTNQTKTLPADTVVLVTPNHGNRELYDAIEGRISERHLVGDASSARYLRNVVRDGHLAGAAV